MTMVWPDACDNYPKILFIYHMKLSQNASQSIKTLKSKFGIKDNIYGKTMREISKIDKKRKCPSCIC